MAEARICFSAVPPSRTRCLTPADRAMVRSQWSVVVSAFHGSANKPVTRFEADPSLVAPTSPFAFAPVCSLLPVWPSSRRRSGVLGRRGFAVESAVAQICREGGAGVSTNVMLRDLDISPPRNSDGRRLEVVAEGLT